MNSLDERYGSTYRIRAIADQLKKSGYDVSYYEKHTPFYLKVWDMKFKSLLQSYDVLIIQRWSDWLLVLATFALYLSLFFCSRLVQIHLQNSPFRQPNAE